VRLKDCGHRRQAALGHSCNLYIAPISWALVMSGKHMRGWTYTRRSEPMPVSQHDLLRRPKPVLPSRRTMRPYKVMSPLQCEQRNVTDVLAEISAAQSDITSRSAAALAEVRRAVITGEGPSVAGRVHFSRTLDVEDVALCARILILAGHNGDPVSRAEADALFDINAAGGERCDGGRFDDLLAKAVAHHVMSSCGRNVPRREVALALATPVESWTSAVKPDTGVRSWLEMRLRELRSSSIAARAIAKAISGTEPPANSPKEVPIAALFDLAA